ncbi:hypothetical protein AHAS_Ahas13G0136100 [Arachis hypogaea]
MSGLIWIVFDLNTPIFQNLATTFLFSPSFPFSVFQLRRSRRHRYCCSVLHISAPSNSCIATCISATSGCCKRLFPPASVPAHAAASVSTRLSSLLSDHISACIFSRVCPPSLPWLLPSLIPLLK